MIIAAKYLMTGDGKTVLENQAVLVGQEGKLQKIAPLRELTQVFPEEEVKDYGEDLTSPWFM